MEQRESLPWEGEELKRLVNWISKNWDDWRLLCDPYITDTSSMFKRRVWVAALKNLAKERFPSLVLVFMTKCYCIEGRAKEAIEGAVIHRILSTWDDRAIDEFVDYLGKVVNWDARELPNMFATDEERDERYRKEREELFNPSKEPDSSSIGN